MGGAALIGHRAACRIWREAGGNWVWCPVLIAEPNVASSAEGMHRMGLQ